MIAQEKRAHRRLRLPCILCSDLVLQHHDNLDLIQTVQTQIAERAERETESNNRSEGGVSGRTGEQRRGGAA